MVKRLLVLLLLLTCSLSHAADKLPLFDNGEAAVKIVLPKKASAGER
ncbi:MAG: hypothetical protein GXP25_03650, partial [Planctomycetes bacterium]|nr:hypothetical protein [Planctomycetota bacterium]